MTKLNLKQQTFVDEYIKTGTAYQSAIRAGYSEKYAKSSSHKLLENVGIKAEIDKRMEKLKKMQLQTKTKYFNISLLYYVEITDQELIPIGIGRGEMEVESGKTIRYNARTKAADY